MAMVRALVLIGVQQSGNLPALQAVKPSVSKFVHWGKAQGILEDHIHVLTDDEGKEVRLHQIADLIESIVAERTVEQLIIYFAGHGLNNRGEYWLLSRAPKASNEAVNVEASIHLARTCGIPHVVFISDACRTAARGIQNLNITGGEIFPNESSGGLERPVDAFFACTRGRPSFEIRDKGDPSAKFNAIYSDLMIDCLSGNEPQVIDYEGDSIADSALVRVWKLADFLQDNVPKKIEEILGVSAGVSQIPDARLTSRNAWLSRMPTTAATRRAEKPVELVSRRRSKSPLNHAHELMVAAFIGDINQWCEKLEHLQAISEPWASEYCQSLNLYADGTRDDLEPGICEIEVIGATLADVHAENASVSVTENKASLHHPPSWRPGERAVIEMATGIGIAIPTVPGSHIRMFFNSSGVANIVQSRGRSHSQSIEGPESMSSQDILAATISASTEHGLFRLSGSDDFVSEESLQRLVRSDIFSAIVLAYELHKIQHRDRLDSLVKSFQQKFSTTLYDLELLSGRLIDGEQGLAETFASLPIYSSGWALLPVLDRQTHDNLKQISTHLLTSPWTTLDAAGVCLLKQVRAEEIRKEE